MMADNFKLYYDTASTCAPLAGFRGLLSASVGYFGLLA